MEADLVSKITSPGLIFPPQSAHFPRLKALKFPIRFLSPFPKLKGIKLYEQEPQELEHPPSCSWQLR